LTLGAVLAAARERLVRADISSPEAAVDVDLFARTILQWDRARLLTSLTSPPPETLEPRFSEWLARRELREPTAYIVGTREFWGRDFVVTPAVLIPRPETEFIVEEASALLRAAHPIRLKPDSTHGREQLDPTSNRNESPDHWRIADVGTGSGCIAVSLAHETPGCRVVATDVSTGALAIARQNAERLGVADRIDFVETSYLDDVDGTFDLIAANPPYVRDGDKPALSRDVRHEPDVALFGGATGLTHLAAVADAALSRLKPGGWLVMEFGFGQEDDVRELVARRPGLRVDHVRADLQGLARTAIIQKA
jgi:release factor glutamine methyltransferase